MNFVEANIGGDLPAFYKALSENLKILETGLSRDRYRVAPPAADLSAYSLIDYKRNYRPHIYSYEEYAELFPQWFKEGRRWSPMRTVICSWEPRYSPVKRTLWRERILYS